jgi:hypothetical protein
MLDWGFQAEPIIEPKTEREPMEYMLPKKSDANVNGQVMTRSGLRHWESITGRDVWWIAGGEAETTKATDKQVGGSHYKDLAIQPTEYAEKNNLGFAAGNVVKYVTRYKSKGGVEDLQKARHYIDLLIQFEGE